VQHEAGERAPAWEHFSQALALAGTRTRATILSDMGRAAEREGDFERAAKLFEDSLAADSTGSQQILSLCRLARVHRSAGRNDEARTVAGRAETLIQSGSAPDSHDSPEVFYTLGLILGDDGRDHLERANELVGMRTRAIRSVVYRQHYLTTRWPNREILEEARRLRDDDDATE